MSGEEEATALLHRGNELALDDEGARAAACYEAARAACPPLFDGAEGGRRLARLAALLLDGNRFEEALEAANAALRAAPGSLHAYYRKALACFYMDEFETARKAFVAALDAAKGQETALVPTLQQWVRKCDAELEDESDSSDEEDDSDVEAEAAPEEEVNEVEAPTGAGARPPKPPTAASTADASAAAGPSKVDTPPAPVAKQIDFYQSMTHLTIPIMVKGIKKEESTVEFTEQTLSATLRMPNGSDYVVELELFAKIKPEESKVLYRASKVEIKLAKAVANTTWPALERSDIASGPIPASTSAKAPSPYAGKKDWSKLEKELAEEEEKEKPEGEAALNKLFQQIYRNADEKTRMAMNKSFQTSGGTVLSTNWGEVENQDYEKERKAPDGMEWRKWG